MRWSRRQFVASATLASGAALIGKAAPAGIAGTAPDVDVIVLGAGLSGLHAAQLLEDAGARVLVLEGRSRVGGVDADEVQALGVQPSGHIGEPVAPPRQVDEIDRRHRRKLGCVSLRVGRYRPIAL